MAMMRPKRSVGSASARPPQATQPRARRERVFALDIPFSLRGLAGMHGARWAPEHGVYLFTGDALPPALTPFRSEPYSLERRVEESLNDEVAAPHVPTATITPRPHQRQGVEAILAARRSGHAGFLLADDVGLGKTITAWEAVLQIPEACTVLVVSPLAVVAHWRRTIAALGDGGKAVTVLNYERLGKLFELTAAQRAKVKSKKGLAKAGAADAFDVVIWDESHRLKNPAAARSKLAAKLTAAAGFTLWLSATAGQNPLELSYLAPLLARVSGDSPGDLKAFEAWCLRQGLGVTRGAYGRWDWRGDPDDCDKVRRMLFDGATPGGIRRRPEDIAGWPELNRMLTPIALEGEARALYEEAWTTFRREMSLEARGNNPRSALAATLRLRQKGSLLRVPGTVELARELLENGHQVAISVAFMETLTALQAALTADVGATCATIHGQQSAADKERQRMRFQRGDDRVVLFTVEEGISLHQGEHCEVPRSEVIHDLRWSAIQMAQIEGRCHRDGRFAQVYWAYAADTIEERIATIVCRRIQSMKGMVGDDVATLREIETLLRDSAAT